MPPEQLPWDRRDFRKHDRSASDPRFGGGGFGGAGPHRWRENHHHTHAPPPPPSHPPPYHHHHNHHHQQQRWYSDFRDFRSSRPIPSGHGKPGGWHMYPDDAGHGFLPFGSRYGDRHLEDDNFQPLATRSDGRYFRSNKESRGSFSQKDWRSSSWEPAAASSCPGKSTTDVNNQKLVENTETFHNNSSKSIDSSHPLLDSVSDPSQSLVKEKQQSTSGTVDGLAGSSQKSEKENGLESVDWKPLKWTRSGSLPSRGSGFNHTSGPKNVATDSVEMVTEVQQGVMPIQLAGTSNDMSTVPASFEENNSRKKPRLGWGEGLAKYEKKKVEGPEDGAVKDGSIVNVATAETVQSPVNLFDKSPRVGSMSDCTSPATPSSVACSSSPGIDEKDSIRPWDATQDNVNLSCSPCITSQVHYEGPTFNLENLDITSIAKLSSFVNAMLQSEDLSSVETDFVRTTSMNKLLVWKAGVLKALEVTESTIDSLETELKSLIVEPRVCCPSRAVSRLLPGDCPSKPCEEQAAGHAFTVEPDTLQGVSSGNIDVKNMPAAIAVGSETLKGGEIICPGSATFRMTEVPFSGKDVCPSGSSELEGLVNLDLTNSSNLNQTGLENGFGCEVNTFHIDVSKPTAGSCQNANIGNIHPDVNHIYDSVLAANKESASSALKELNKFLPSRQCFFDISISSDILSFQRDSLAIKEKFLLRKRSFKFKEKVLTLRFRVFRHFWKEGCVVSVRKLKGKTQKISDISLSGLKRNRSSNRSRISYFAWNHQTVPAEEVIKCINELLAESSWKPCRSSLKMPALILDKETKMSRFISNNGLVEDPCAVEKERATVNPWTAEETEIFIDKLAIYGKDFRKIASFLDYRTIADCIEFYYKNHKSESFMRARKKPEFSKQRKSQTSTYLVATGKRWNREVNATSLDILDEASAVASNDNHAIATQQKCTPRIFFGASSSTRALRGIDGTFQRPNNLEIDSSETAAADVLAGICGSRSSEAMNSCITSAFDHADGYQDWKCTRVGSVSKQASTPDYAHNVDDECSDDSCRDIDSTDWTDEEKSTFIQAVSSSGKDFVMISQLVRTKSEEQCKIFFSKARKCLGLDQIHPEATNSVPGVSYGGGSDNEDGCVVQTGSTIRHNDNDSGFKVKEDLPPHEMKVSHESDVVATHNFKPEVQICEENSGSCPRDSVAAESVLENSAMVDAQVGDTSIVDCNAVSKGQNGTCGSDSEARAVVTSSCLESGRVEEGRSCGLANGMNESDTDGLPDLSGSCREESEGTGLMLSDDNLDAKKVAERCANSTEFTSVSCSQSEMISDPQPPENALHASFYAQSSTQAASSCHKEADFESFSGKKSCAILSHENGHVPSLEASMISAPFKDHKHLGKNALANVGAGNIGEKSSFETVRSRDGREHLPGYSLLETVDCTQILRGYPVSGHYVKEIKEDANCKTHALQQNSEQSGNLPSDQHTDFSIQKCTRPQNEVFQAPLPSQGKNSKDNSRSPSGCSADSEMPPRNGDVKLFGKILISSQQNPNSCVQETCDDNHKVANCQSPNLGLSSDHKVPFDSSVSKFDCSSYTGSDKTPVRSIGFGDGNKTLVGFPPLSDSTLLLAKYPAAAAFGNLSTPTVKLEQPPFHVVRSNTCPLNGVGVLPSRELSSSTGVADCQVLRNREVQSVTKDMEFQTQDVLLSEMQRRNRFNAVQGMQMQQGAFGMLGINVVGGRVGVVVGGGGQQFSTAGVSDPVAAMKMQFAKARGGNTLEEDNGTRRNNSGDVGSR